MTVGELVNERWTYMSGLQAMCGPQATIVVFKNILSSLGIWDAEVHETVVQPAISSEGAGGMICVKTHAENAGHKCRVIVLPQEEK